MPNILCTPDVTWLFDRRNVWSLFFLIRNMLGNLVAFREGRSSLAMNLFSVDFFFCFRWTLEEMSVLFRLWQGKVSIISSDFDGGYRKIFFTYFLKMLFYFIFHEELSMSCFITIDQLLHARKL